MCFASDCVIWHIWIAYGYRLHMQGCITHSLMPQKCKFPFGKRCHYDYYCLHYWFELHSIWMIIGGNFHTLWKVFFFFFTFVVTELQIRRRRCYLTWLVRAILAAQQGPTQYIKQMVLMWSISAYSLIYILYIYIFCVRVFTHPSQLYLKVNKEHLEDFMSFKNAFPLIVKGVKHLCH